MAIVPSLVRFLRPYYRRKIIRSLLAVEDVIHNEALESEASDRLDVHLAFMSCVAAAVFYLSAAASKTSTTLIFCKSSTLSDHLFPRLLTGVTQLLFALDWSPYTPLRHVAWSPDRSTHSSKVRFMTIPPHESGHSWRHLNRRSIGSDRDGFQRGRRPLTDRNGQYPHRDNRDDATARVLCASGGGCSFELA